MQLKSMELTGFKSFAEAKIEFPKGITAIVGPNGTGKSNIVDAVLWVLGEQSTKTLRSERMEDVIFNGTALRKPLGMVEVSLVMSGLGKERLEGLGDLREQLGDFHEVMITRRLYRNGDSEYLINKTLCRLKDIRGLFMDTRAGTKGHTVIEQGRLDQILNASPRDRRELIEETAGIVRYKKQKAEALRKLDATQQNLLRVKDIVSEVRRQLNSLERQARQARVYRTVQEQARTLEVRLLVRDYRSLRKGHAVVEAELTELDAKESGLAADEARLASEHEAVRLRLHQGEDTANRLRESVAQVEHEQGQAFTAAEVERGRLGLYDRQRGQAEEELARLTAEREQAAQRLTEVQAQLAQVDAEMIAQTQTLQACETDTAGLQARRGGLTRAEEDARRQILDLAVQATGAQNAVAEFERRGEELGRRSERLTAELAELVGERAGILARLEGLTHSREAEQRRLDERRQERDRLVDAIRRLENRYREADERLGRLQEEAAALESRQQALSSVVREDMGYGREGDEDATSLRKACSSVQAAMAEWLAVPPGLERAIEAVLGERVRGWMVEGPAEARQAIDFLKSKGLGRGAFVPLRLRQAGEDPGSPSWWTSLRTRPGVRGLAAELVQPADSAPESFRQALAWLLRRVVIVESYEQALALWVEGPWAVAEGPTLVTLEGEVVDPAGIVIGGESASSSGLLQRRREIQELDTARQAALRTLEQTRREREAAAQERQGSREALQRAEEAIRSAEMQVLAFQKDEAGLDQDVEGLQGRAATVRAEQQAAAEERAGLEAALQRERTRLAQLNREQTDREASLATILREAHTVEAEAQTVQARMTDVRLAVTTLQARREHDERDLARLRQEQQDRESRIQGLTRQQEELEASARQSQVDLDRNMARFRELEQRAAQVRAELVTVQDRLTQALQQADELDRRLAEVRESRAATRTGRTQVEVRRAEIKTQLASLESTLTGTYQLAVEQALTYEPDPEEGALGSPSEGEAGCQSQIVAQTAAQIAAPDAAALREELQKLRDRLQRMGPINLASIEEHQALEERYRFLVEQEKDLTNSISALKQIISRINRTTKQMFMETFAELQQKFSEVFVRLFPGGRAELLLVEPQQPDAQESAPVDGVPGGVEGGAQESVREGGEDPGVDIVAQPPGKRLKSITMLSGGEKTLTAMALLFASFLIRPTPFCILDEIDAPLDEENIGRFTAVLRELAENAQFLVVTHNKRTMAVVDSLFGVTMEEPGVSKLVSVRLAELQPV